MAVADTPVIEISSLILQRHSLLAVIHAESLYLVAAEALLYLPASHIYINDQRIILDKTCRTRTDDNILLRRKSQHLLCCRQLIGCEIVINGEWRYVTEQHIIGHKTLRHSYNLLLGLHHIADIDNLTAKRLLKGYYHLLLIYARIELNGNMPLLRLLLQTGNYIIPSFYNLTLELG